jgi:abortive infection bacteriophage resistance protein
MTEWKEAFWYLDTKCFYLENIKNLEIYSKLIWKIKYKKSDKESIIVKQYFRKYKWDYLPSWMLFELFTIWEIANIYKVLNKNYRENISLKYDVNFVDLHTWIVLINKIRNISAHHSRLWNIWYNVRLKLNDSVFWDKFQIKGWTNGSEVVSNFFNTALIINHLINKINPNLGWLSDLKQLFEDYPEVQKEKMWFLENWEQEFEQ